MKQHFVQDILNMDDSCAVSTAGWIRSIRSRKTVHFIELMDSTGMVQVVVDASVGAEIFAAVGKWRRESAIKVVGTKLTNSQHKPEVLATGLELVGEVTLDHVSPRSQHLDLTSPIGADGLLRQRHFMLRNPQMMALMTYRHLLMQGVHHWFTSQGFIQLDAPILTPLPLYDDGTAVSISLHDQNVFLTQCVGFYMEAAAHAFERVYNMGPSFRGEESKSLRHLMEYWHIKAEMLWADLDEGMTLIESLMAFLVQYLLDHQTAVTGWLKTPYNSDALHGPFPRLSYGEVVNTLNQNGFDFPFGRSLGNDEEQFLSKHVGLTFWVVGIPRTAEPFPYVVDPNDPRLTRTADLIASRGYGELLGVAEKITDPNMLRERMAEKGKLGRPEYNWLVDLHQVGMAPHIGFGMGVERFLRWVLQIRHVRDAIAFPRTFNRQIYP